MHIFDDGYGEFIDEANEMEAKVKAENANAIMLYQFPEQDTDEKPVFFLSTENESYEDLIHAVNEAVNFYSGEKFVGDLHLWSADDDCVEDWSVTDEVIEGLSNGDFKLAFEFYDYDSDIFTLFIAEVYSITRVLSRFTESEKKAMRSRS